MYFSGCSSHMPPFFFLVFCKQQIYKKAVNKKRGYNLKYTGCQQIAFMAKRMIKTRNKK